MLRQGGRERPWELAVNAWNENHIIYLGYERFETVARSDSGASKNEIFRLES